MNHVYHPYTHTSQAPTPALPSLSHTLSVYTHAPHPHRVRGQPHRQTKDDHMNTHTTQAHRPNSKVREIHYINGFKNKLEKHCLFTTHMQISSQFRKPSTPLNQKLPKYITLPPCAPIGRKKKGVAL